MSPNCHECRWGSCIKSRDEKAKSCGEKAVGFSRTSPEISILKNTCTDYAHATDGRAYKRKTLQGMSVALLSEENITSANHVDGPSPHSDNKQFTVEKEIVALAPISCVDDRDPLISGPHRALKPAAVLSSQLETAPKCVPNNICHMRKNKAPLLHIPNSSMTEEKVSVEESAGNLSNSVLQQSLNANDGCSSPKCKAFMNMKSEVEGSGECSSSDAVLEPLEEFTSARELCIYVLKSHGLLKKGCTPSAYPSEIMSPCNASPLMSCKVCEQMENHFNMLICDLCEEAFHVHCCKPKVKKLPADEWYCQPCFRKIPKPFLQNLAKKSLTVNDDKFRRRRGMCRDLNLISFMLKYTEPYTTQVRIGKDFQAGVPHWSGPDSIYNDYFLEPPEMNSTISTSLNEWHHYKSAKQNSIGNWIQCRGVTGMSENNEDIVCGKWRRAPLFVVQTDNWDCSCALPWDPFHADCAVPQELETEEVLRHLKYIDMLRPRLAEKKRKINET